MDFDDLISALLDEAWLEHIGVTVTAIFAYVNGPPALMAADTLRADPLGLFPNQIVTKIYTWGNGVLFGHAGNGPKLERLANDILSKLMHFTPDEAGFCAAFASLQPTHYRNAIAQNRRGEVGVKLSQGTFIVAVPQTRSFAAHIFRLDFATGQRTPHDFQVAAEGTNPAAFEAIGRRVLENLTTSDTDALPGDLWAADCINEAIGMYPKNVGLPFDLALSITDLAGAHVVRQNRFTTLPISPSVQYRIHGIGQ